MAESTIPYNPYGRPHDDEFIYEAPCIELNRSIPTSRIELYEALPEYREGATKATIQGSSSSLNIYHKEQADCSLSIDRLVWVDGWRQGGDGDAMTLVVLKLGFKPRGLNAKVSYASVSLTLRSDKKEDEDPKLEAWGPFRSPEMWNATEAHMRKDVTSSVNFSGGAGGQQVSFGTDMDKGINWDKHYTDYGLSGEIYSRKQKKDPNGVQWQVCQNKLLSGGITPEIRVAALFSRPPPSDRYRVELNVVAHTGTFSQTTHKILRTIGKSGGDSILWGVQARPGLKDNCYWEGLDIIEGIDPSNLGLMADRQNRTNLNPGWLNKWDRVEAKPAADSFSLLQGAESSIPEREGAAWDVVRQATRDSQSNLDADVPRPVSGAQIDVLPPAPDTLTDAYGSRLIALEERAARADARIAEQDRLILGLQRTLTRVAQALLHPALLDARAE